MLTDSEIAGTRSTASDALAGTAVVKTRQRVSDGGGGGTLAWVARGTFDARLGPQTAPENAEPITGNRDDVDADWVVTLPALTIVETTDRIEIQDYTLEVSAVYDRTWELTKRVVCKEVT